jgi:hypothetical protein
MRINPFLSPIVFIVALLGSVVVAQGAGVWSTSGRTAVTTDQLAPADIKGWMTLQQVIDGTGVPPAELYALVNIPPDVPPATALKDLEGIVPGFEITVLRDALTARQATVQQQQTAPPTLTPVPTTEPVIAPAQPTATPRPGTGANATGDHATPTLLQDGYVLPGSEVKGRMNLREVSDQCAVPLEALLSALGLPANTDPNTALRDLISQGKLAEVTAVQQAVTALQSK